MNDCDYQSCEIIEHMEKNRLDSAGCAPVPKVSPYAAFFFVEVHPQESECKFSVYVYMYIYIHIYVCIGM